MPDPGIINPRDAILRITSTAICGSDLHLYDGYIPTMKAGDILGHEFMGEVVDVGQDVTNLKRGDRVVVPHDRLRRLLLLQEAVLLPVRQLQHQPRDRRDRVRLFGQRAFRLLAHAGRLRRRSGGVCAGTVRGRRADEGAGSPERRAGALPLRYLSDRLHGGRELQHRAGGYGGGVGVRAGRALLHQERVPPGRNASLPSTMFRAASTRLATTARPSR